MSRSPRRDQTHELEGVAEDLLILGGSTWKAFCSCGWSGRPASAQGIAIGLFRRHCVLAGRGQQRTR
jgi:hypothetical protein